MNKILKITAGVFSIIAFCMLFGNQIVYQYSLSGMGNYVKEFTFSEVFFEGVSIAGLSTFKPSILGFLAYLLILIAGVLVVVPIFIKKLDSKIALIGSVIAALLSVTSIIFLFCIVSSFTSVNDVSAKGFSLATTPIIAIISSFIVLGLIVTTVYLEHFKKGK